MVAVAYVARRGTVDTERFAVFLARRIADLRTTQTAVAREMARHIGYATEEEYAIAASTFQRMINRAINGQLANLPDPDTLNALAAALHCTTMDLLDAAGYGVRAPADDDEALDDVQVYTAMMGEVDSLRDAPEDLKAHIRQTIEFAMRLSRKERQREQE